VDQEASFIANGVAMRKIRVKIDVLARVDVPVLICGESGCGRESAARLIHQLSNRAKRGFRKINCAALNDESLEHELFGHRNNSRGSEKSGAVLVCSGGTIFLQEVTHVHTRIQAQLLEVLHEHAVSTDHRGATDVRILASTGTEEFGTIQKRLPDDFYDRLSAFTLDIPPLRDRADELPALAVHFMDRLAHRYGIQARSFSADLFRVMEEHTWPGNLRELEIFVQRYLVMGDEQAALRELVSRPFLNPLPSSSLPSDQAAKEETTGLKSLVRNIKGETEKSAIATILEKTRWNRKEAARLLGISYRSLLYKIEQYELSPHTFKKEQGGNGKTSNGVRVEI
jgi:two-component system, NtrC family, response regulator AtoC